MVIPVQLFADKMDKLGPLTRTQQEFQVGCRSNSNTSLLSFKTTRADRDCSQSGKEEDYRAREQQLM